MNIQEYNKDLASDLAYEIFNHEMPSDPEELAKIVEDFLNED